MKRWFFFLWLLSFNKLLIRQKMEQVIIPSSKKGKRFFSIKIGNEQFSSFFLKKKYPGLFLSLTILSSSSKRAKSFFFISLYESQNSNDILQMSQVCFKDNFYEFCHVFSQKNFGERVYNIHIQSIDPPLYIGGIFWIFKSNGIYLYSITNILRTAQY